MSNTFTGLMFHDIAAIRSAGVGRPLILHEPFSFAARSIQGIHPLTFRGRLRPIANLLGAIELGVENQAPFRAMNIVIGIIAIGLVHIPEAQPGGPVAKLNVEIPNRRNVEVPAMDLAARGINLHRRRSLPGHDV